MTKKRLLYFSVRLHCAHCRQHAQNDLTLADKWLSGIERIETLSIIYLTTD